MIKIVYPPENASTLEIVALQIEERAREEAVRKAQELQMKFIPFIKEHSGVRGAGALENNVREFIKSVEEEYTRQRVAEIAREMLTDLEVEQ